MTGATGQVLFGPNEKRQKEYLAIFKLYTDFQPLEITRLLNHRFGDKDKDGLPTGHKFDVNEVEEKWESMKQSNDSTIARVQSWGDSYWRVKRVLRWAEVDEEESHERLR